MTDIFSREIITSIHGRDTTPEKMVRSTAHRLGFRFRRHVHALPGSPDIIFPKLRKIILVNEVVFGFFRYPEAVKDVNGRTVAETGLKGGWYLSGYVDSADPRYRRIVRLFAAAGYLQSEEDEFAGSHTA